MMVMWVLLGSIQGLPSDSEALGRTLAERKPFADIDASYFTALESVLQFRSLLDGNLTCDPGFKLSQNPSYTSPFSA